MNVSEVPKFSIIRYSQQFKLSRDARWNIMRDNLGIKANKIQFTELALNNQILFKYFANRTLEQLEVNSLFHKVIYSDKSYF